MPYVLTCGLWLPLDRRAAFRFFEDPANLPRITPPWLHFRIVTEQITLRPGCVIDYTIRWGLPMRWRTLIDAYEPPRHFIDTQQRGPYRLWRHEHTFTDQDGGTVIDDTVTYLPPLGPVGRLLHWAAIGKNLREIFEYRQRETARLLLADRAPAAKPTRPVEIAWR
jgi:ligand-binding SRPBCC domain-containing protein